jgi:predicted enzyme related to lactoylglutathione lyase
VPNPICHFELMVSKPESARRFYASVFDWAFDDATFPGYTLIKTGAEPGGGMIAKPPAAPVAALNVYFRVDQVDLTLRKVVEAGGTVVVPKTEIPGVGFFAMFLDPEQIPIGVLEHTGVLR